MTDSLQVDGDDCEEKNNGADLRPCEGEGDAFFPSRNTSPISKDARGQRW